MNMATLAAAAARQISEELDHLTNATRSLKKDLNDAVRQLRKESGDITVQFRQELDGLHHQVASLNQWRETVIGGTDTNIIHRDLVDEMARLRSLLEDLQKRVVVLEERLNREALEPEDCRSETCSYYQHYLAIGPAELVHEGYHAAERQCARLQEELEEHEARCPKCGSGGDLCSYGRMLDKRVREWEERIRA
jgi:transcriptional regulator of heat shock response